jgi:dUTP pyrophosphatase
VTTVNHTHPLPGAPFRALDGRMVYFAHPVDFEALTLHQREQMYDVLKVLRASGAVVYDPAAAFDVGSEVRPNPSIAQVNRAALLTADVVVACWPETPGIGVAMEIQLADSIGMPTLVLTGVAAHSWTLAGLNHATLVSAFDVDVSLPWLVEEAAEYAAIRGAAPAPEPLPLWVKASQPRWVPNRGHDDDAAFDLFVSEETKIEAGQILDVPAGCAVEFPAHIFGLILGRSSTSRTHRLLVHPGVIDTGFRGPLFVQVENLNETPFVAQTGMRLGQLIPLPNLASQMAAVPTVLLSPSVRGERGFGSSGE